MKSISNLIGTKFIGTFVFTTAAIFNIMAQDWSEAYSTTKGTIKITGEWNDTILNVQSQDLIIMLNYESAEFQLKLDKSTLTTGVDSIDQILGSKESDYIEYEGKLDIERVKTEKHPPMDFLVEGQLKCNNHNELLTGTGHLEHIYGDVVSCILNMTFHLSLSESNLTIDLPGLKDEIHIEIVQSVLNRNFGD